MRLNINWEEIQFYLLAVISLTLLWMMAPMLGTTIFVLLRVLVVFITFFLTWQIAVDVSKKL
jgi:Flp pilus assembly protein TadB